MLLLFPITAKSSSTITPNSFQNRLFSSHFFSPYNMRRQLFIPLSLLFVLNLSVPYALAAPRFHKVLRKQVTEYSHETEIILTDSQLDEIIHLSTGIEESLHLTKIENIMNLQEYLWRPIAPSPVALSGIESEWGLAPPEQPVPSVEPTLEPEIYPNSGIIPLCSKRQSTRSCMRRERCDRFVSRRRRRRRRNIAKSASSCAKRCRSKAVACV